MEASLSPYFFFLPTLPLLYICWKERERERQGDGEGRGGRMTRNTLTESPLLPWRPKILLYGLTFLMNFTRRRNGTINRRLLHLIDLFLKVSANNKPRGGVKTLDITIDATRNLWFRLFIPTKTPSDVPLPVIIFFHGGGFAFLSPNVRQFDHFCRRLSNEIPAVIVSVNYRLSPEHRFPSQYDDGFDTLKFLDEQKLYGFPENADLSRCFLAGDSAGGNLTHHVACRAGKAEFRQVRVIGQISIQPFFGGEERTESEIRLKRMPIVSMGLTDWLWKAFLPEGENRDHEAVNVMGPRAVDITEIEYPETMVVVGGFDPLKDRQREFYKWLRRSWKEAKLIEYPRSVHGFYAFPEIPDACLFMKEVKGFVHEVSAKFIN
ncbi:probable carboxylesterase 18 [Macadamia integrifolia]|uniref:probable carboxylesterase 18 n=1 Tax=Macadamia integrifolia TaxID=60698 RepID=UPI001C4FCB25|nr:probable carboxylesterase 18 [Macadamia integrifolia]